MLLYVGLGSLVCTYVRINIMGYLVFRIYEKKLVLYVTIQCINDALNNV